MMQERERKDTSAKSMNEIAEIMKHMKFRRKLFMGVDEADVWRKLEKLQKEYRAAFDAQQERNNALVSERDDQIYRLKSQLFKLNRQRGSSDVQR